MSDLFSKLTVPAQAGYLKAASAFINATAEDAGFEKNEINSIDLAFEEVFMLIISRAFDGGSDETVDIEIRSQAAGISVSIREKGLPFDISTVREYSPASPGAESAGDDLMVFLARKSVDEFVFSNLGRDGREFRLTKNLSKRRIENILPAEDLRPFAAPEKTAPKDAGAITIRPLKNDEAIEISRCAYRAYGFTYADFIYYPEKIAEMNAQGLMRSIVAVASDGDIMGHVSLRYPCRRARVAEIGTAFVKPEYRGAKVFNRIVDFLIGEARKDGVSIYAESVTSHVYSQKEAARNGLSDCALMLAYLPADTSFKGIAEKTAQKESCVVSFLNLAERRRIMIYPPERHAKFTADILTNLGIPHDVRRPEDSPDPRIYDCSVIESRKVETFNVAEIAVRKYGVSAEKEVRERLRLHLLQKADAVYLYLDLSEPATCYFAEEFEKMGFFFAGVFPDCPYGFDALMMQRLNNVGIDFGNIMINSEAGRAILDYVRRESLEKT